MNLALSFHWPRTLNKGISFLGRQSSRTRTAMLQLHSSCFRTELQTGRHQLCPANCQAIFNQALYAFRFHTFTKGREERSLAPAKQQHTKQLLCQDLALKSLKTWCSQSINNLCLTASSSCTSTFPKRSYTDPPIPILSPSLRRDRHANKKASCHGIFSPYRQMSIKNQVSLRFASQSSFQFLLPAHKEFPLCPFTSDVSMHFSINPWGLEGNYYRTGTFKGQI